MKNRAKCRLCGDILESFHETDYVKCSCEEISIYGGRQSYKAAAKDFKNFLRIDDEGNEIEVKWIDKEEALENEEMTPPPPYPHPENQELIKNTPSREELIDSFRNLAETYDNLPKEALYQPVTHADLHVIVSLLGALLRDLR